jgi:DNA-binding MarR family transcriptional regulator
MFYQALAKSGLHPTEFLLVELIAINQKQNVWCDAPKTQLAKELKISPSRVFNLLYSLTQKGFIIKSNEKSLKRRSQYKVADDWTDLFGEKKVMELLSYE